MQHFRLVGAHFLPALLIVGCVSVQETDDRRAADVQARVCELSPNDLQTLRIRALEHLVREWPVLDERCEDVSDTVVMTKYHGCMILGGPRRDDSCEPASHFGYGIVFDGETLDPLEVRWLTESEQE